MSSDVTLLPSTAALQAFEAAGRCGSFSQAALELGTSQPAISRTIRQLERQLGTELFVRSAGGSQLTEQGLLLHGTVRSTLSQLGDAIASLQQRGRIEQVTVACSYEVSHLLMMDRFDALSAELGSDVRLRVMTHEYESLDQLLDDRLDLTLTYGRPKTGRHSRVVQAEAVRPVVAPGVVSKSRRWPARLPLLELTKPNHGWATWDDYIESFPTHPAARSRRLGFDNYVYLLEAAAAGKGVALGWKGLSDRYEQAGTLVPLTNDYAEFARALIATLTPSGRRRPVAAACLELLASH